MNVWVLIAACVAATVTIKAAGPVLCPSAPAAPGAALVGVVEAGGRVVNLVTPLRIEAGFVEAAAAGPPLEKRFRFAAPCQQGRCGHWAGHQCGLIGQLRQAAADLGQGDDARALPPCAIRAQCRWWRQSGREACAVCSLVVTDQRPPAAAPAFAG